MNTIIENGITVLYPSGNWLTNGDTFSDKVYLGKDADASFWRDATDEEYEAYQLAEEEPTEEATEADYLEALERLGVTDE